MLCDTYLNKTERKKKYTDKEKKIIDLQRQTSIIRKNMKKKLNQMSLLQKKTNIRRVSIEFGDREKSDPITLYQTKSFSFD